MNFVSEGENEIAIQNSLNILFSRFYPFLLREMTKIIETKLRLPLNLTKLEDPVSSFEWAKDDLFIQKVLKPYYLRFLYNDFMQGCSSISICLASSEYYKSNSFSSNDIFLSPDEANPNNQTTFRIPPGSPSIHEILSLSTDPQKT